MQPLPLAMTFYRPQDLEILRATESEGEVLLRRTMNSSESFSADLNPAVCWSMSVKLQM